MRGFRDTKKPWVALVVALALGAVVIPAVVMTPCHGVSILGLHIDGMGPVTAVFKSVCGMIGDPSAPDGIVVSTLLVFFMGLFAAVASRVFSAPALRPVRVIRPIGPSPPRPPDELDTERLRL